MSSRLVPASPKLMIPWIIEALDAEPLNVKEILGRVEIIGHREGFSEITIPRLKKALAMAKAAEQVRNPRKGWWILENR